MNKIAFCIAMLVTTVRVGLAEPEQVADAALNQLAVELTDGSRLIGVPAITSAPIVTAVGKIAVPLKQIATMTFSDDHEGITVALANGDRLTGVHRLEKLRLKCIFGDVTVNATFIRKVECVWGDPLSQAPVDGLLAWYPLRGDAKDTSGNGFDGVLTDNVFPAADRFGSPGAALRFTGESSYVRVPNFAHNHQAFAACVWVKPSHPGPLAQPQDIISKHGCPSDMELLIRRDLDGKYGIEWNIGGTFYDLDSPNVGVVEPSYTQWDFLVLQYTGSSIQFYVNGKLERERNASGLIATCPQILTFGGYGSNPGVESFIGQMDDIRFYNRFLKPTEIDQLYKLRKQGGS